MDLKDDKILNEFISDLKKNFGSRLKSVLFFGSRARGDYTFESDYDCILLFDNVSKQDVEFVNKLESQILLEYSVLFSTFIMSEEQFRQKKYEPFLMNAKREGIYL